ncbi:DUF881 domain-containing protein [Cellulomonas sp. DKR-3]|uniref:DUF881 domain-containing protein n=2 Tax=Cellulomonas fulva TaxID=2835530 RepID=A0ABS5U172_9CELL|nr:DUF881 domain-containing protein [Cellulomonas fulva]
MTLLTEVYRRPLDPGYALAARRRAAGEQAPPGPGRRAVLLVAAVLLGLAVTAAALTLHQPTSSAQRAREVLEGNIVERSDQVAALQEESAALGEQITALQSALVGQGDAALRTELAAGTVEAGQSEVTGPGLRVELSDAPSAATSDLGDESRVQDVDLQVVVNGLWSSGAEAVAINGQRVTSTTAIRSAGSAVLVDLVPLTSPYRVDAIGSSTRLQTGLVRSSAGQLITALRSTYGIGVDISAQSSLDLPGAGQVNLRHATVPAGALPDALVPSPTATPSAASSPSATDGSVTSSRGTGVAVSSTAVAVAASSHDARAGASAGGPRGVGEESS